MLTASRNDPTCLCKIQAKSKHESETINSQVRRTFCLAVPLRGSNRGMQTAERRGGGRLAAAKGGEQGYRTLRQGSESPRRRRRYAHRCRRRLHVPFHSILTERWARGSADSTAGTSANPNATAHTPLDCCDGPRMPSRCCLFGSITLTHTIHRVSTSRAA